MDIEKIIIISVISGTAFSLGLLLVILGLIFNFRKKRLLQKQDFEMQLKNKELEQMNAVVLAQENERSKIARNLHDELGAILSMAQRNLSSTLQQVPEKEVWRDDMRFVVDVLEQSVAKIRSISQEMMPHFLVKFGLLKTMKRLVGQTEKTLGYPCSFSTNLIADVPLDEQREIHFYCVALELLNNLLKHGRPQHVDMSLIRNDGYLYLKIAHDGVAISQGDYEYLLHHGDGLGLESVSHRLNLISGELLYQRHKKGGTVELAMPLLNSELVSDEKI